MTSDGPHRGTGVHSGRCPAAGRVAQDRAAGRPVGAPAQITKGDGDLMTGYEPVPPRPRRRPQTGDPRRGYRDGGYREGSHPGRGYRDGGYRAGSYPGAGHRGDGHRAGALTRSRAGLAGESRAPRPRRRDTTGGAEGNERLTAAAGAVLLVLFAAEGVTILAVRQLLTFHFFIGMLLIGPVVLKAGSTIYRFARYYTGVPDYRRKGPPAPLLRLLGPLVLGTSLAVIGTGVILGYAGSNASLWLFLHKAAFVLWFGVMTIHVLAYTWRLPRLIGADLRGRAAGAGRRAGAVLAGRPARWLLLTASVLAGLLLAILTARQAGVWLGGHPMLGGG